MADKPVLYDQFNRPIVRATLKSEVAGPTVTGVRSPLTGYPGDGLNPQRLAALMREADAGDPLRYLELAETIEERDAHYVGVLGTRKRSVAQLDITVESASKDKEHEQHAETVRDWLGRDELQDELFGILDAIGKGYSLTEIIWDTSMGQWRPLRLELRDPRWFRFRRDDLTTPMLLSQSGQEQELPPFKFIYARIQAKSGLPARSGVARVASWLYMFKKFAERDWAIFTQTFGQPVRVGKYGPGATEDDKDTLFRAVANIAGDCAAIIPDPMVLEFIESKNVTAGTDLYERRAKWIDEQCSKLVLGQTATTDAISGGHAVGQEHRQVQEDIERADAKALSAILNRDLVRPWVDLEYGPQQLYPRIRIGRQEARDLTQLLTGIEKLVPMGVDIEAAWARDQFGIPDPEPGAVMLKPPAAAAAFAPAPFSRATLQASPAKKANDEVDDIAAEAERLVQPAADALIDAVRGFVEKAQSLEEIRDGLLKLKPDMPEAKLAELMRMALVIANLSGRAEIIDSAGGD